MSLRLRLSLILGSAFVLLWSLAAVWMLFDLRNQLMLTLDQRLASSARMVSGLLLQLPQLQQTEGSAPLSTEQLGMPEGIACQISSVRGEILASSRAAPGSALGVDEKGFHERNIDGITWRTFTLIEGDMRVTTADRLDERDTLNHSILLAAAAPVVLALLGSLLVLWVGLSRELSPLRRIRQALAERSADSIEPLHVDGLPQELQPLVATQNQLFQRIGQAIERERRLTDDAAHELRSPLTAIKTHLQVASMTEGAIARQALAHAEAGTDRLHQTLEQLLLLARVEGRLPFDEPLQYSAAQVAHMAISDAQQPDSRPIELHLLDASAQRLLAMPPTLAIAALRNLLDNAQRHNSADAAVSLSVQSRGEHLCFSVQDAGPGVAAEKLPQLTERFWRNSAGDGSGLGLSIVNAIVQRCGGALEFVSSANGLRVDLVLPSRSASEPL
ncbi:ATP-binding protein [Pseudomonas sp. GWSMS-1]|uniref:ATP-binding protein n=1 Tax=Pseudomonas sp. GWSMS-1 TaxID=3308997 RepID=UPI003CEDC2E2